MSQKNETTFWEEELKKIFTPDIGISELCVFGHVCYGKLSDSLFMKACFREGKVINEYTSLEISIISCENGMIDTVNLYFSEILGKRQISSSTYPNGIYPNIHQKGADEIYWELYQPTKSDYKMLSDAVRTYLNVASSSKVRLKFKKLYSKWLDFLIIALPIAFTIFLYTMTIIVLTKMLW